MRLRLKFNLVMLTALGLGLGLAAALSHEMARGEARASVLQEAAIMMSAADAISGYTDHEIAPLLAPQVKVRFLPQSIPFFAAQTNFRRFSESFPNYTFREPALNPTNPADRATDWQADIIDAFRRDPARAELVSERDTPLGTVLSLSHPIRAEQGCLQCHSTPAAAPASMVDLYGSSNGFGWKAGEVVGAAIVSLPMQVAQARAWHTFALLVGGLALVFLVVLVVLNLLLELLVLRPVRRLAAVADEVSGGNMDVPEYAPRGGDEIASLAASFNRMRRSVATAMRLLEG